MDQDNMAQEHGEEDLSGPEKRLVFRVLTAWRQIQEQEGGTTSEKFTKQLLGDDWAACSVIRIVDGIPFFHRVGDNFTGQVAPGDPVDPDSPTLMGQSVSYWRRVISKRVPITLAGEYTDTDGKIILYRSGILPLSEDGIEIRELLVAANSRIKEDT